MNKSKPCVSLVIMIYTFENYFFRYHFVLHNSIEFQFQINKFVMLYTNKKLFICLNVFYYLEKCTIGFWMGYYNQKSCRRKKITVYVQNSFVQNFVILDWINTFTQLSAWVKSSNILKPLFVQFSYKFFLKHWNYFIL